MAQPNVANPNTTIATSGACGLSRVPARVLNPISDLPRNRTRVILDGLLGLGARSDLNPALKSLTREINALRLRSNADVYAVDLPTGLGEESIDPDAVLADYTVTIGFPKTALFREDASNHVGRILVARPASPLPVGIPRICQASPPPLDRVAALRCS